MKLVNLHRQSWRRVHDSNIYTRAYFKRTTAKRAADISIGRQESMNESMTGWDEQKKNQKTLRPNDA